MIKRVKIGGDAIDTIIAAGGDPGADGMFANGDVLAGGHIASLVIGGVLVGARSPHTNPGIYAATLGRVSIGGVNLTGKAAAVPGVVIGSAVIDPLPAPANALDADDIKSIVARAAARASQLGVNATIALTDREGNILAVSRMTEVGMPAAATTVSIDAGGRGGLEAVDGIVATSLIAATKAGTAAFLSTSAGNAFTTRTAGHTQCPECGAAVVSR